MSSLSLSFLVIPSCPVPLLGRDILQKLGATIHLSPSPPSSPSARLILFLNTPHRPAYSIKETQALQALGGKAEGKGWIYIRGRIALPENLAHTLITDIHQSLHIGPRALNQFLQPLFYYPSLPKVTEDVHRACKTCSAVNAQGGIRRPGPNHQL